jgi:hypothetical protein
MTELSSSHAWRRAPLFAAMAWSRRYAVMAILPLA